MTEKTSDAAPLELAAILQNSEGVTLGPADEYPYGVILTCCILKRISDDGAYPYPNSIILGGKDLDELKEKAIALISSEFDNTKNRQEIPDSI